MNIQAEFELLLAFLNDELTEAEFERLDQRLCEEPDLADRLARLAADEGSISDWAYGQTALSSERRGPAKKRPVVRWASLILSLAAVVAAAIWLVHAHDPVRRDDHSVARALATITGVSNAIPGVNQRVFRVGQTLEAQRVSLTGGSVEILLHNGVTIVLEGPAELQLMDAMHAWLHDGRVVFRVPPAAIGFSLETSEAKVLDLGTEFGVRAGDLDGTVVQVYEGEVIAEAKSDLDGRSRSQRLESGQAVRIVKGTDSVPEELPFWPDRFVRFLPDPRDHPDAAHQGSGRKESPYNKSLFDEIHIVPAPSGIVIDGSLKDWDLSGQFTSRCESPYESYYHVQGAMMYDKDYLYIGARVGDPFPMRSTVSPNLGRELYGGGGCLAFRISTDRDMGWPAHGEGQGTRTPRELVAQDYNDKLAFLVLWYYQPDELPCLDVKYGMDQHGRKVNPPGYRGAFQKHSDGLGYTAEYAIPWALLNVGDDPPRANDTLACTWLVHWAGPEGRNWKGQLIDIVNPRALSEWNFQNAATWGRAIYHHQGRLPSGTVSPLPTE